MSAEVTLTVKGEITRMRLQPDDKVVVSVDRNISPGMCEAIHAQVKSVFPDHEVVMVANGIRLEIVGAEVAAA